VETNKTKALDSVEDEAGVSFHPDSPAPGVFFDSNPITRAEAHRLQKQKL
jgi:hypothetical protein